jgi:hypothetical protein
MWSPGACSLECSSYQRLSLRERPGVSGRILHRLPNLDIKLRDTLEVGLECLHRGFAGGRIVLVAVDVQLSLGIRQRANLLLAHRTEIPEIRTQCGHHFGRRHPSTIAPAHTAHQVQLRIGTGAPPGAQNRLG